MAGTMVPAKFVVSPSSVFRSSSCCTHCVGSILIIA